MLLQLLAEAALTIPASACRGCPQAGKCPVPAVRKHVRVVGTEVYVAFTPSGLMAVETPVVAVDTLGLVRDGRADLLAF